jgi:[ribosomal protein S5]-alanine N-acetyltransferase
MATADLNSEFASTFLAGEVVALRPLVESDADGPYPGWLNDAEVCRHNSHHVFPYTPEQAREWIRSIPSRGELVLAVTLRGEQTHVGNVSLQAIDRVARSAELAILLGERSAWGRGVGLESAKLVVAHGFEAMNLHRISCATTVDNVAMRRIAERLGMQQEGVRREAAFNEGRYVDVIEYGLLAADYRTASS